jgi:hypothetical protein
MQLIRWGQRYHEKNENGLYAIGADDDESKRIQASFRGFGWGPDKTSDFGLQLNWDDVQTLIQGFAQMGHPEAIRLQNASKLATAVESAGWSSDDAPQSN